MKNTFIAGVLAAATGAVLAQATPVGLWKTIDDETKIEKSLVCITETGGVLNGKIKKLLDPASKQDAVCEKCSDERKDKPVLGMTLLRNARADAANEVWEGGDILDPNNGKVYRLRLEPLDSGKRREVRGYIGPFYRNQQWIRVE